MTMVNAGTRCLEVIQRRITSALPLAVNCCGESRLARVILHDKR